jgi:hypothetical protein
MCRQRLARVLLFGCLLTVLGGGAPLVRPPAAQAGALSVHAQAVQVAPALDWTALPVPLRPHAGDDGDKDDGDKCSVVELKCDEVQQQQECIVPSKVVRVVPVPVVKVVTVEKKVFVPVEKVVKVFVPVEKKVFVTVEKKVFVPVPVEKVVKVFVPVPVPATPEVKVVPVPATPVVKVVVPVPPPVTPTPMPMPPGDPMF